MTNKTKNILIFLSFISFLVVGVLLIMKVSDIGKLGADISYDGNGCPKTGTTWSYDSKTNKCTLYSSPTNSCASGYSWSSKMSKCYKKAIYANNTYNCPSGDTKVTNNSILGNGTYCTRNADNKICKISSSMPSNTTSVLEGLKCKYTVTARSTNYTITFNANGGSTAQTKPSIRKTGSKIGLLPTASRSGYIFKGWYTSKSGGTKVTTNTIMPSKNIVYYAQWQKALITDTAFYKCVINSYNKEKGAHYTTDYQLTIKQLNSLKTVECTNNNMKDLNGIEYMTSLTSLTLGSDNLYKSSSKNPDLSKNVKLENLTIKKAKYITYLDLSYNTKLKKLILRNMDLEEIKGLNKLKNLYSITLYNLPEFGKSGSYADITSIKFQTIHRTPYIQGYIGPYVIEGLYAVNAAGNTKGEKLNNSIDIYDVYETRATTTGKTSATIVYSITKNAQGAKITKVEYKNKNNGAWKGLPKANLTYNSDGSATIKFTKSQTIYLRITTKDGVSREVGYYNINITGDN